MSRTLPWPYLIFLVATVLLTGCVASRPTSVDAAQELQAITIDADKLSGSPRQVVQQLNKLIKAQGGGVEIVFDPAVDPDNCNLTIFLSGEPLAKWLQSACRSCGATYRISGNKVVVELLPIADTQTVDLAAVLPEGMAEICAEFRSKQRADRLALGGKLMELLPQTRLAWSKESPGHHYTGSDYRNPNYKLYKKDVLILLGEPNKNVNNQIFRYSLEARGKATLSVHFDEYDYVVDQFLVY